MMIIGIDPGSIKTGFGIIKNEKNKLTQIAYGTIHAKGDSVAARLYFIYKNLCEIILLYQPNESAIEEVFMHANVQSALKLGQARGAALVALAHHVVPVHEYSARVVKKTATGFGAADKTQIQFMVKMQLGLKENPPVDAADALAIAICHAQHHFLVNEVKKSFPV